MIQTMQELINNSVWQNIKNDLRQQVNQEVQEEAEPFSPKEEHKVKSIAKDLKQNAIDEVAENESELKRSKNLARVCQIIDYVFYVLYALIGLEIMLELLGARESSGFK